MRMVRPSSRLSFVTLALLAACTRLNPAFDEGEAGTIAEDSSGDEVEGSSGESSTSTGQSETGSETGNETGSETQTDEASSSEGMVEDLPIEAACGEIGYPFALKFFNPEAEGFDTCQGEMLAFGYLAEGDGTLMLETCTPGCLVCGEGPSYPISVDYDLSPLLGTCVAVEAEQPTFEGAWCSWAALSVFDGEDPSVPYLIAANRPLPTWNAMNLLGGWPKLHTMNGVPVPDQTCTCADAGFDDACCMGEEQFFTTYSLLYNQGANIVQVGGSGGFEIPSAPYDYDIYNAMAHTRGMCSPGPELAWKVFAINL